MTFPARRFPDDVPVLVDGDVTLRAHRLDDTDELIRQCTDPRTLRWTTVPLGYDDGMARTWLTEIVPGGWVSGRSHSFAVQATHPDGVRRYAGSVELRAVDGGRGELAFVAHPAVRGAGVMTTAARLLLAHAFDTLDVRAVTWWAEAGNWGSRQLAWSLGFCFAPGIVPHYLAHRERLADAWVGTLTAEQHRDGDRPTEVPVLECARVRLRPLRRGDDPRVVQACTDPLTRRWLPELPDPYTAEDAAVFRLRARTGVDPGRQTWAVADRDTDLLLGVISLDAHDGHHEIGYWAHPDARGRGTTREAVDRVVDHVRAVPGEDDVRRLVIRCAAGNAASLRVAEAAGFTRCGVESAAAVLADGRQDRLVVERVVRSGEGR